MTIRFALISDVPRIRWLKCLDPAGCHAQTCLSMQWVSEFTCKVECLVKISFIMMNRIIFADNPWPCGHAIKTLTWSARLDPKTGLWFDLHLVSDDYYAENNDLDDNANENYASDWDSKRVWGNYHRCILSSTYWGHAGFLVATENSPLDFDNLSSRTFSLDPLPPPEKLNERAFGIYLLGHDGVADHQIRFTQLNDKYFELDWHGKIALEYVGNYNFDYSFHARFDKLTLSEILLPEEVKESEFLPLLKRFVVNLESLI